MYKRFLPAFFFTRRFTHEMDYASGHSRGGGAGAAPSLGGRGCGLRWRALDTAMSTPAAACVAAGVAALNDFSVTADGGRVLFSSTRREQDIAVAALRPSR